MRCCRPVGAGTGDNITLYHLAFSLKDDVGRVNSSVLIKALIKIQVVPFIKMVHFLQNIVQSRLMAQGFFLSTTARQKTTARILVRCKVQDSSLAIGMLKNGGNTVIAGDSEYAFAQRLRYGAYAVNLTARNRLLNSCRMLLGHLIHVLNSSNPSLVSVLPIVLVVFFHLISPFSNHPQNRPFCGCSVKLLLCLK